MGGLNEHVLKWPHDIYIDVALKRVTLSFQAWLQKTIRINKIHDIVIILVVLSRHLTGGTIFADLAL